MSQVAMHYMQVLYLMCVYVCVCVYAFKFDFAIKECVQVTHSRYTNNITHVIGIANFLLTSPSLSSLV